MSILSLLGYGTPGIVAELGQPIAPLAAVLVHASIIALLTLYAKAVAEAVPIWPTKTPLPVDASTRTVGVGRVERTLVEPTHCLNVSSIEVFSKDQLQSVLTSVKVVVIETKPDVRKTPVFFKVWKHS